MLGDLDPYDNADPPLGNEFGYLNDCQEPQSQLLKERLIRSLSKLSQASRIHCTNSRRGGARMFSAPRWEGEGELGAYLISSGSGGGRVLVGAYSRPSAY